MASLSGSTHHERRLARLAREAAGEIRVSWRKVSDDTGGGWSGYGPGGQLVYVRADQRTGRWEFGRIEGRERILSSSRSSFSEAKAAAAALLR